MLSGDAVFNRSARQSADERSMSNRHRGVACGAALTGAFLAAPSFLAPNGQTPSVPRVQGIVSYQAQGRSPGSAIPGLAVAGVATSALAALKVGKTTSKVPEERGTHAMFGAMVFFSE
eukprot:g20815.t1